MQTTIHAILPLLLLGPAALAQDVSPHTEQFVEANGIRVHCLDWGGEGQPLVMLTGYGATAHSFDDFAPRFTDQFHVVSFTRRGTAPTERTATGYDIATLTQDLEAVLNALGLERVNLVGHSIAGVEMTEFAALHPERVASLVYLDAALDFAAGYDLMREWMENLPQPQPGSPYSQILQWQQVYTPDFSEMKAPALAFYTKLVSMPVPNNAPEEVRLKLDNFARTKWAPLVDRMADKFRTETKTGRAIVFEDASHYIFRDRADDVIREMRGLYSSLNSR